MSGSRSPSLYIGLISGTSMDGIDAALCRFGDHRCELLATHSHQYSDDLATALLEASRNPSRCSSDTIGELDRRVGLAFRDAATTLMSDSGTPGDDVAAIGSHGQTLRHQPQGQHPFTMQLGDPNLLAAGTGITTVADFRRRDMALGGQGAPLAPAFHHWLFGGNGPRAVVNLGGFANVTVLAEKADDVIGFDTGPANSLMDSWCRRHQGLPLDEDGRWAASGRPDDKLLAVMLDDPWFGKPPPKSTGFEYFDDTWLERCLARAAVPDPTDVQATLCELTARSVADAIGTHADRCNEVLVCGGGARNSELMRRLQARLGSRRLQETAAYGVPGDWLEAAAFAWLAYRALAGEPGNLPAVTGARESAVLGGIYPGRS